MPRALMHGEEFATMLETVKRELNYINETIFGLECKLKELSRDLIRHKHDTSGEASLSLETVFEDQTRIAGEQIPIFPYGAAAVPPMAMTATGLNTLRIRTEEQAMAYPDMAETRQEGAND